MTPSVTNFSPQTVASGYDQIPISYESSGTGTPSLLFVHGWACRRNYWKPQVDYFSPSNQTAIFDLPGHGDSSAERRDWSIAAYGKDVATVAAELSSPTVLIGHSMGGAVALEAARAMPENKLAAVVLVDTFLINYGELSQADIDAFYDPFADNFSEAMAGLVENCSVDTTPDTLKAQLVAEMSEANPAWALPVWHSLLSWGPAAAFASIKAPIHAINCPLISDITRERLAEHMSETVIPDTGHFLQMERPALFNQTLEQILVKLSGTPQ